MNLAEAAHLLLWTRDQVRCAIEQGVRPPNAGEPVRLTALRRANDYEIDEADLDQFLTAFDSADPGRWPPTGVRRQLFYEARESCSVCGGSGPFEFHHLLDWARLKHHDPAHMMLVCRNCHGKCTNGSIDRQRQRLYKRTPFWKGGIFSQSIREHLISWSDLREVVVTLHSQMGSRRTGAISLIVDPGHDYTYTDLERKNELNHLSDDDFAYWQREFEPRFILIKRFLGDDRNVDLREQYLEIVGDLRSEIAAVQGRAPTIGFDEVMGYVFDAAFRAFSTGPKVNREALRTVMAFMYFECDIGRK